MRKIILTIIVAAVSFCASAQVDTAAMRKYLTTHQSKTEMIEKCKWILTICHVLSDVYLDVIEPAFREMNLHFDWQVFAEDHDLV